MTRFTGKGRHILILWTLWLVIFYIFAGYFVGTNIYNDRLESDVRQQQRLDPTITEDGKTQVDKENIKFSENELFDEVSVGIYVDPSLKCPPSRQTGQLIFISGLTGRVMRLSQVKRFRLLMEKFNPKRNWKS